MGQSRSKTKNVDDHKYLSIYIYNVYYTATKRFWFHFNTLKIQLPSQVIGFVFEI